MCAVLTILYNDDKREYLTGCAKIALVPNAWHHLWGPGKVCKYVKNK